MASQTDQRATDFEEVKKILAQHPRISLVQTEGEPPDCYQIEYLVTGLVKMEDGSIARASRHAVLITLPFGYPHFPPAVKPLTPVFHPDVDPDGVRISSRWQQEPSLAKIIPYIGEMLCGKVYSLDEPFNQEAADWYASHAAELPLDVLEGADTVADDFDLGLEDIDLTQTDSGEEQDAGISFELEGPQTVHDIAGLAAAEPAGEELALEAKEEDPPPEDDGLDLGLEIGEPEAEAAAPPEDFGPKLAEIRAHLDRREFFIAERLLKELPPALPEAEPLRKKVKAAQAQCDQLLQEMKVLEDEDNFPEAQKVFEKLKKVAADMPGLAEIGRRLQQSQSMLDTFSLKEEKPEPQEELVPAGGEKKKKAAPPPLKQKEEKKEKAAAAPPKEKKEVVTTKTRISRSALHREIPVMPFVVAAVAAALIVAGGVIYTRDSNMLLEAELNWQEAQQQLRQKNFKGAEEKANTAMAKLTTVITPLPGKSRMKKDIDELFAKEEFQRGSKGEAKYKDKYLPIEEVSKREQFDKLTAKADQLKQQGKFGEAAAEYEEAVKIAAEPPAPLPAEAEQFREKARQLRMKETVGKAGLAESAGEWEKATSTYEQALELAKDLADEKEKESLRRRLAEAKYRREMNQSQKSYTGAQWDIAVAMLERAKKVLDENPESATAERRQEVDRLLVRSRLQKILAEARQAYDSGDFAAAVKGYKQTLTMLNDPLLPFDQADRNAADSISRTAVMIEVGIELNGAVAAESKNDLDDQLRHYRAIQELLGAMKDVPADISSFRQYVNEQVKSIGGTADMKRKTDWLNRNYKSIFLKAYPQTRAELLSSPSFALLKKMDSQELYKLNCTERSYIRLEVCCYLYTPATGQWTACPNCQ